MLIESMEIYPVRMSLIDPIPMASGVIEHTRNVVVSLTSDDGLVGWGEGVEAPALTHQDQATIVSDLEALAPLVRGADPLQRNRLWLRLRRELPAATTAIGAIDIAVHDLAGKAMGVPVHQLVGGAVRDRVPALTLVGSGDLAADADKLVRRRQEGYRWFKIKLGMAPPEVEVETLARAVELAGEDGMVCGDVNEGWTEDEAGSFLSRLTGLGVRFVEQPVSRSDPEALLRLARRSPVPLCADESAATLESVARLAGTGIGGVSLKLIKHGGITGVMRGAGVCSVGGLAVNLAGKVIESSISAAANLHCAAAMDAVDYGCSPANQGVVQDLTEDPVRVRDGVFRVPHSPGLGVDVDRQMLAALAV